MCASEATTQSSSDKDIDDKRWGVIRGLLDRAERYHLFLEGSLEAPVPVVGGVNAASVASMAIGDFAERAQFVFGKNSHPHGEDLREEDSRLNYVVNPSRLAESAYPVTGHKLITDDRWNSIKIKQQ